MRSFFSTFAAGSPKTKASPLGGEEQAEQQLDGGGLAGAVGAEQAEDFALVDLEVEGVEGGLLLAAPEVAVDLGEASGFDDGIGHYAVSGRSARRSGGTVGLTGDTHRPCEWFGDMVGTGGARG